MKDSIKPEMPTAPILFPFDPKLFWETMRLIVREEMVDLKQSTPPLSCKTPGLSYKPLYKITEVCQIFQITKPTIYEWIRHGKLKPYKIRSRVFFLWQDIQRMLSAPEDKEE